MCARMIIEGGGAAEDATISLSWEMRVPNSDTAMRKMMTQKICGSSSSPTPLPQFPVQSPFPIPRPQVTPIPNRQSDFLDPVSGPPAPIPRPSQFHCLHPPSPTCDPS